MPVNRFVPYWVALPVPAWPRPEAHSECADCVRVLPHGHKRGRKRVTRKQNAGFYLERKTLKIFKSLILKTFKKLAWLLLYLSHNKNKKIAANLIKTRRNDSDITKTTRQRRS
ncbi:hypothetical protein EMIT0196MI5_50047 [Pseudomonas sp. IT-196MI5]